MFCQYCDVPIASTTEETQAGPPVVLTLPGWSEFVPRGITQLTLASLPLAISVKIVVSGVITLGLFRGTAV